MIIIDNALENLKDPIRVGMIGSGFMGKGVALQIINFSKGINLVAIANRTVDKALKAYYDSGFSANKVNTTTELDKNILNNIYSVTDDPMLLCRSKGIDIIIEVTGTIEHASNVIMEAIKNKKHIVSMNAELDGTLGPIFKKYADESGVIITNSDGDQPGVMMNLYRFVKGIGLKPVLIGNIKGFHNTYANPTTQEEFAKKWKQNVNMITSFTDGTKISYEQAIVANATGMKVAKRGMYGMRVPIGMHIKDAGNLYPISIINAGGIVDYVIGAEPAPGVFVLATQDNPIQKNYLSLYKLGNGPVYCFYTPYHLCHFELPNTIARVALFKDTAVVPLGKPMVDVICIAKRDLKSGEILDGFGGYMLYGLAENSDVVRKDNILPFGLSEGCKLNKDIKKDEIIRFNDVEMPCGTLREKLWNEQNKCFFK